MRGEIDFQKYSQHLGKGLFADNVILSILDYKEKGTIDLKGKEALKRAKVFLSNVINGGNLQGSVLSSSDDVKAAKAFNAVRTHSNFLGLPASPNILDRIINLHGTVDDILNNKAVSEENLNRLDNFFSSYSRINFQATKSVLEAK